jgi:hypothetical protein
LTSKDSLNPTGASWPQTSKRMSEEAAMQAADGRR